MPSSFALIRLTKFAKERGIDDDFNRVIYVVRNGRVQYPPVPYSEERVRAIMETDEIPIVDEREISGEDEFRFEDVSDFGEVTFRRR